MLKSSDLNKLIKHNHNNNDINSTICFWCGKNTDNILYVRYKLEWVYAFCDRCFKGNENLKKLTTKEIFYLRTVQPDVF